MDPTYELFFGSSTFDEEFDLDLTLVIKEERSGNKRGSTSHISIRRDSLEGHQHEVEAYKLYYVQRRNVTGRLGHSSLAKITAAIRILAYGLSGDFVDEYSRIAENTTTKCLTKFVKAIIGIFSIKYLRLPNDNDIARLLTIGEICGFPGMLGRSHNDINFLEHSSVFKELTEGHAPKVNYSINGHGYSMRYYLADGIYFSWSTFVKTILAPQGHKRKYFAAAQESTRKDVERAFGVLQA
ncbi:uncharacterized protein LOC133802029 [Humulus lupulus]|uniref:uncharacterized protein LOC133802029 n=1 Tax=Humulus lupulus TaxID=3486 RepID=UPI002B4165B6|nr:uncharacterized protein LOC133802029 [Humulus lupulus]